jgi:hypothetical protein
MVLRYLDEYRKPGVYTAILFRAMLALILDALSGRNPLFLLPQAFAKLDTEYLCLERPQESR